MHQVAESFAELGVVGEHQGHLAEGQVTPEDGVSTDVPPEGVHRVPACMQKGGGGGEGGAAEQRT